MKVEFSLSIGYSNANQKEIVDVDDAEVKECKTKGELADLISEYWKDWSSNYIDGGYKVIEE